jgi:hypothetical protein
MDYIVRDSSILPNQHAFSAFMDRDTSIRIGIVREEKEVKAGNTVYMVEVLVDGKVVIVSCVNMVRFGGAHNFEEYKLRPWLATAAGLLSPAAGAEYKARSGDVVVVAYLNGKSREGVILGGLDHSSRKPVLKKGDIGYLSEFNGLETSIASDGSYKVTFKGYAPINDPTLKIPPTGIDVLPPVYNPLTGGSYYGFSSTGSFVVSDGSQFMKIHKNKITGSIILKSGSSQIELGGNPILGAFQVTSNKVVIESTVATSIKSVDLALQAVRVSVKGIKIAIGNDQFELFDGLIKLIDALGSLVVTSPVGTCTPLKSAPTWAAKVLPLKIKLNLVKGSLKDADSFSLSGDDDSAVKSNSD